MRIPTLEIRILLESNPVKFRVLVRRLAASIAGGKQVSIARGKRNTVGNLIDILLNKTYRGPQFKGIITRETRRGTVSSSPIFQTALFQQYSLNLSRIQHDTFIEGS